MHLKRSLAAVTVLGILALTQDAMAQTPAITTVSISGTGVSISGTNLTGTSAITIADQAVTAITVNADGTLVMGDLLAPLAPGSHRMTLTVTSAPTSTCPTVQPASDWICLANGGWVPPGHPLAATASPTTQTLTFIVAAGVSGAVGPAGPPGPTGATGPAGPSGGAILADGTAASPSLAFINSPATGFYRSATDAFTIATAGTGRLTVRADGDLEFPGSWRKGGALFLHAPGTNVGLGLDALQNVTLGEFNVAIGGPAPLGSLTTGSSNVALGRALVDNTTGHNNIGIGTNALASQTIGSNNIGIGTNALLSQATGSNNIGIGTNALLEVTSGSNNIAIGILAAANVLGSGNGNIHIGHAGAASDSSTIRIGSAQLRTFIAGIRGTATGVADAIPVMIDSNGQLGTVSSSRRYKDDIRDMGVASSRIHQLRPVTFRYVKPYRNGARPVQFGLIAEEVAEVFPELVVVNQDGQPETVKYQDLTPMLLNELQNEHVRGTRHAARIEELEAEVREQRELIAQLLERLAALEAGGSH